MPPPIRPSHPFVRLPASPTPSVGRGSPAQRRLPSRVADQCLAPPGREDEDLKKLSELGHFLKGSSATLGLVKVRDSCEKIQRYGKKEDEEGNPVDDEELCLKKTGETLKVLRVEYDEVEVVLKKFFGI